MKYLKYYETFTNKVIIGVDIDGTINDFFNGFNLLYKKYFPEKEALTGEDEWYWYRKMDYDGVEPVKWFREHKSEIFDISQPYPDAVTTINNIYDFAKSYGFTFNIVTHQPTEDSKDAAEKWLQKCGFKYDGITFTNSSKEKWNFVDIMIDDAEKVLNSKPLSKISIKIVQPYNINTAADFTIQNIKGLTIDLVKQAIAKLKNKTTL